MNSTLVGVRGDVQRRGHRTFAGALQLDGINDILGGESSGGGIASIVNALGFDNRWALSMWVDTFNNSDYNFLNFLRTTRALFAGNWNQSQMYLTYGGSTKSFSLAGVQSLVLPASATYASIRNWPATTWRHLIINHNPTSTSQSRSSFYDNSVKSPDAPPIASQNPASLNPATTNNIVGIGAYSYNGLAFTYLPIRIADLVILSNYNITDAQARQMYNFGTNTVYANYPAQVLTSRHAHYPLGAASDFSVSGPNLFANDISGNGRNLQVFGQGTTPNIVSFL